MVSRTHQSTGAYVDRVSIAKKKSSGGGAAAARLASNVLQGLKTNFEAPAPSSCEERFDLDIVLVVPWIAHKSA